MATLKMVMNHVEVAEEGVAREGVIGYRIEGCDDEGCYAGVVKMKHDIGHLFGVAGEEVADATCEQAEHGPSGR